MACTSLVDLAKDCENNIGGATEIILNDQDQVTSFTVTGHKITAMVHESAFKSIYFKRNVATLNEEEQRDLNEGSNFVKQTIELGLKRREAAKSAAIKIIGQGQRDLAVVIGDGNGLYWYVPNAQLATNAGGLGKTKAEGSKYDLTFVAENEFLAYEIDAAVVAQIKAAPAP
jgi:hypothetical protein